MRVLITWLGGVTVALSAELATASILDKKDCTIWSDDPKIARLLKVERISLRWTEEDPLTAKIKEPGYSFGFNNSKTAYFMTAAKKYAELLVAKKNSVKGFKFTVPEWKHRPIRATWKSDRILRIETSFSPRSGAYWEYDVAANKTLNSRFGHDDTRCQDEQ